ncbi:MAG TPA: CRTAC1 family protein [Thermoanaerobaculia bacterium]|nr:CRTAC1 family protein [Thermoanaerobaculia bacterium]
MRSPGILTTGALVLMLASAAPAAAQGPPFREMAAEAGIDFTHFNGMSGKYFFPEMLGPGVALLDYDGDGDLDVFALQGTPLAGEGLDAALFPPTAEAAPLSDRLYRNDLEVADDGSRTLRFTDVTAESTIPDGGFGMGVAAGDFDNDGRTDLYVANYGSNRLLRNVRDGVFADVTESAGADDKGWSTSAAFVDYDRDGRLDLMVINYVDFSVTDNPTCFAPSSRRDYCGPSSFPPTADRLLRNRGDGTFEDVTEKARLGARPGPGLGVVVTDADRDGWPDLYVANDGAANQLWHNRGDGTFSDEALLAGAAVNGRGQPEAGMGVDADDFDNDGDEDVFLSHLRSETNTLYVNESGDGLLSYRDRSSASGLGAPSLGLTGFGAGWLDYDNDGWLDVLVVNGAERIVEAQAAAGDPFPLAMPNQLFRNQGDGSFTEVSDSLGEPFTAAEVSRGAAFGDLDDDGDVDFVVTNANGPLRLFVNQVGAAKPWFGLRLVDGSGRDALGARVEVKRGEAPSLWRRAASDGSFLSANDPRVLVGLGDGAAASGLTVHWPDGTVESFPAPQSGRYTTLAQGSAPEPAAATSRGDEEPKSAGGDAGEENR